MLGLKLPTDERWAKLAESNLEELLTDHAYCEQKAASNAITMIIAYPELSDLVQVMTQIVLEEMDHFRLVHEHILKRGWLLGKERKDDYVNELLKFVRRGVGREVALLDRLLFAAMIEARSCERFKLLSNTIQDEELKIFYHELMISEANHYTTFIKLAKKYINPDLIDIRWKEFLEYEAMVVSNYGKKETMHG